MSTNNFINCENWGYGIIGEQNSCHYEYINNKCNELNSNLRYLRLSAIAGYYNGVQVLIGDENNWYDLNGVYNGKYDDAIDDMESKECFGHSLDIVKYYIGEDLKKIDEFVKKHCYKFNIVAVFSNGETLYSKSEIM